MEMKLIDVSKHQGKIDWSKVKNHIDGAIIRCGYGNNMKSQDDVQFKANVEGCLKYGIPFGVYLYSYAKTIEEAIDEAEHVLRLLKPYKGKLSFPVYYDLEEAGTEKGAVERAVAFGEIIENAGYWCGIYANQYWWQNHLKNGLDRFTKWVAKYSEKKPVGISGTYDIWQYTSSGSVDGIKGRVDMNICYRDFPSEICKKAAVSISKKTVEEVAEEVIAGKWGSGTDRKNRLTSAGYDYSTVQAKVNQLVKDKINKKSVTEIAKEVIAGKWGNNPNRKENLKAAGYDYNEVQKKVNELLK